MGEPILKEKGIGYFMGISGASLLGGSGENIGMAVVGLKPWSERSGSDMTSMAIEARLRAKYGQNPNASVNFFALSQAPANVSSMDTSRDSWSLSSVIPVLSTSTPL